MDVKKKKYSTVDSIRLNNVSKQNFRNDAISASTFNKNANYNDNRSIDDGISSVSHSNSNSNELNKISPISTANLASTLNLSNQNLTPNEAYSTSQRIKVLLSIGQLNFKILN